MHEPDFNSVALSPTSAAWRRAWSAFCDATVADGWDPGYGARLASDLEALDVTELCADVAIQDSPGGGVRARLFADTLERFRERMLELGAAEDDLAVAQALLQGSSREIPRAAAHDGLGPAARSVERLGGMKPDVRLDEGRLPG